MHLSGEEAEAGLAEGQVSEMDAREASCCSESALNIFFLHPRLGLNLPVVPSTCEYSWDPIVTKSQVAPCSLLVLIYCLNVLFWSVLAGAMCAHGDGPSSQLFHTPMERCRSSSVLLLL